MQKINLLILIMLVSIISRAQDITLKFTANHTCTHYALDSIWIENLTQDSKMVLYYPDTIASFVFTGIEGFEPWHNNLYVSQNYPNPFSALTYIDIYLAKPDVVSLSVYDLTGRSVARHEDKLEEGIHRFSFSAGVEKTYILTVTSGKHVEKRIMLQMGAAGSAVSEISYLGASVDKEPKTAPKSSDFNFNLGDNLRFTGYVTDFLGNVDFGVINDAPEASSEYLFDIANTPPGQPSEISGEDDVPENATGLVYEVEEHEELTYLWSVPEGWEVTHGQGSHILTVNAGSEGGVISVNAENNCGMSEASVLLVSVYTPDSDGIIALLAGQESKEWKLYRIGTSMGVGPDVYNPRIWWSLENDGSRPCLYHHTFTFHRDGDFVFDDAGVFWGEYAIFYGTNLYDTCFEAIPANMINSDGVDVSAFLGGTHEFELDTVTNMVTLNGYGAWMGMPQLTTTESESSVPVDSKQFKIESIEEHGDYDLMVISYTYDGFYWDFSFAHYHDPALEPDVVEDTDTPDPLEELTPIEMFNTFASTDEADVQILVPTESAVELTVGVDDPADPDGTKVGEYYRTATNWQELQFATEYYIQFDNFTTVSLDVYLPSSNDYSGPLSKDIAIIIANNHDTPEWWNHHLQYDVNPDDVVLDEWQTFTFQLDAPTSGPGIPNGNPLERDDLNFFAISIGGAGHSVEGTFYIRNFIFGGDENDSDIIYGDGVTDIDGNIYQTVIIGNQEWMAENLRVSKYNNGDAIPTDLDNTEWGNTTEGAYAIYPPGSIPGLNSDEEVLEAYGALYNWYAVDDAKGLCPVGWSVASDDDWTQLVDYVVAQGYSNEWDDPIGAGNALKSCRQVGSPLEGCNTSEHPRWDTDDTHHGFDEFGFSALPGGYRWSYGSFNDVGSDGFWWSATGYSNSSSWFRVMFRGSGNVYRFNHFSKQTGFSIRCFRAVSEEPTLYNLHLEVHPENAGTVLGEGEYQEGAEVCINATAYEGWAFVEWTGDIEVLGDPGSPEVSFAMPAQNISLTANFAAAGIDPENTEILLNKSGAAGLVPPVINNELSRGAAFDGRYVYVASRKDGNHIYYWDVENPTDEPGSLVLTETVSGGTWVISDVRAVDGYIYVSNMTHEEDQVFKIYRWDGIDDDDPQPVFEYQLPSAGIRLGDAISIIGNPPDNGYIFASNFAWPNNASEFYVWKFNGGKSDPEVIPINPLVSLRMGQYGRVNTVPGVDDLLLVTGAEMGVAVMDYSGNILAETAEPMVQNRSFDPRVWEYNGGRYLSFTVNREWEGQGAYFQVLDITDGNNVVEAIQNITAETIEGIKVYEYIFGAGPAIWVGATHGFGFGDNGKPRTMSFGMQNGFVIVEYSN